MKYLLVLVVGAIIGALLALYFFVGAPRVKETLRAGAPVQAPEAAGDPPLQVRQRIRPTLDAVPDVRCVPLDHVRASCPLTTG